MSVDEAARVAKATPRSSDGGCTVALDFTPPSQLPPGAIVVTPNRVDVIDIHTPSVSTISGIHVGSSEADVRRTYAPVLFHDGGQDDNALTITNDQGRVIFFWIRDGRVVAISIAESAEIREGHARC
jgi:hypothetical protein